MRLGDIRAGQKCVIVDSGRPRIHLFPLYTEVTVLGTQKGVFGMNTFVEVVDANYNLQTVRPDDIEAL